MINFAQFGSRKIFRPAPEVENWVRNAAETHLRSRFEPGQYHGRRDANEVIKHQFQFYEGLLKKALPKLAERSAVEFLLSQYDEATELLHGNGILDLAEREAWRQIEPLFKRGIKYIVERVCILNTGVPPVSTRKGSFLAMNVAVICAEALAHLAQESDLVFSIFPEDGIVTLFPPGHDLLFNIQVVGKHEGYADRFSARLRRDRNHRQKRVAWPPFDVHTETHQRFLDPVFEGEFGMSYGHFIYTLSQAIVNCHPSLEPHAFDTLFVSRARLVTGLVDASSKPQDAIERALDGFTVTASNLEQEQRTITKPKQRHRALRRGFFLMPHEEGSHLAFSRAMARENLIHLCGAVAFQKLPAEWTTPVTQRALSDLSHAAGRWFEGVLADRLREVGIEGRGITRKVGSGTSALVIPSEVGQIDFLGFDQRSRCLVVIEAKMVSGSLEPVFWRDELDDFLGSSGYIERFRRKVRWVQHNRSQIAKLLAIQTHVEVAAALVTYYPSIAREFVEEIPCISLTELILDYEMVHGWPYSLPLAF